MKAFKFLTTIPTIDFKLLVLECLKECHRWRMEYNTYTRGFYDLDGTTKIIRNIRVHNFIEYIQIFYVIADMEETNATPHHMRIPYHEYMTYLNGIPEYQSFPHQ